MNLLAIIWYVHMDYIVMMPPYLMDNIEMVLAYINK